jgi:hypothetical protein
MGFIVGVGRRQVSLLPPCVEDYVASDAIVRVVDAFVDSLDLAALGFERTASAATGRPGFHPGDMLRLGIVNLMVAGERRQEPRNRRVAYAAVLTAVMSAQTSKALARATRY